MTPVSPINIREWHPAARIGMLASIAIAGTAAAFFQPFAFLFIALTVLVLASLFVDQLAVIMFWTVPYMIVSVPAGGFTLKLCDAVFYLFAFAALIRAALRRDKWYMPPATAAVITFLGACLICTAFEPSAPTPFLGVIKPTDRNAPAFRSIGIILWMAVSWLVVVAGYNVVGRSRKIFQKCVVAHCLGAGLSSAISFAVFILSFLGVHLDIIAGGGRDRQLVRATSDFFRLAGVAYEPLFLAFFLITALPATVVLLLYRPTWLDRRITTISLALQALAMLFTFSAGGFGGLAVISVILAVLYRGMQLPEKLRRRIRIAGSIVGVLLLMLGIFVGGFVAQLGRAIDKIGHASQSARSSEWKAGLNEFLDYPILGVGPGMSHYHFPQYEPYMNKQISVGIEEVNNIVLGTLGEIGVVGFAVLGFTVLVGLRARAFGIRRYGAARVPFLAAYTASLIGCAVQSMSMNFGVFSLIYFTAVVTMALSALRVEHTIHVEPEVDVKPRRAPEAAQPA